MLGVVLLCCAASAFLAAFMAVFGDPFPISRVGVMSGPGGVEIVNAVCPGERLVEITLSRRTETGPYDELWRIRGDVALPERLVLGSTPPGMETMTPLDGAVSSAEPLSLKVVTSELDSPYSMEFTMADVPDDGVLSFDHEYPTIESFAHAVLDDTPCGDPYSKKGPGHFAGIMVAIGGGLALVGATLIVWARRRARL